MFKKDEAKEKIELAKGDMKQALAHTKSAVEIEVDKAKQKVGSAIESIGRKIQH